MRLPLKIICDMMGIPESQYDFVLAKSNIILSSGDPEYIPEGSDLIQAFMTAGAELAGMMADVGAHKRQHPGDDLTSALVTAELDGERLTDQELASFFILLLAAGNETTRNAISHGLVALAANPDQRAALDCRLRERSRPTAVEEIVRWATPVVFMRRTATRDVDGRRAPVPRRRQVHPLLQLRQPRRPRLPRPLPLRRAPRSELPRRLRGPGAALLSRRPPRAARDHGDVPRALPAPAEHPHHERARSAALGLHQRHQAPAGRAELTRGIQRRAGKQASDYRGQKDNVSQPALRENPHRTRTEP